MIKQWLYSSALFVIFRIISDFMCNRIFCRPVTPVTHLVYLRCFIFPSLRFLAAYYPNEHVTCELVKSVPWLSRCPKIPKCRWPLFSEKPLAVSFSSRRRSVAALTRFLICSENTQTDITVVLLHKTHRVYRTNEIIHAVVTVMYFICFLNDRCVKCPSTRDGQIQFVVKTTSHHDWLVCSRCGSFGFASPQSRRAKQFQITWDNPN